MGISIAARWQSIPLVSEDVPSSSDFVPAVESHGVPTSQEIRKAKLAGWEHALSDALTDDAVVEDFVDPQQQAAASVTEQTSQATDAPLTSLPCPEPEISGDATLPSVAGTSSPPLTPSSGVFHSNTLDMPLDIPPGNRRHANRPAAQPVVERSPEEIEGMLRNLNTMLNQIDGRRSGPRPRTPSHAELTHPQSDAVSVW